MEVICYLARDRTYHKEARMLQPRLHASKARLAHSHTFERLHAPGQRLFLIRAVPQL